MTADAVGGVWPYALDLASTLAVRGVTVTIATMGPPPDETQRAEAARRRIDLLEGPFALEWMDDPWDDVERAGEWLLDLGRDIQPDIVHLNGYCHAALPWRAPTMIVGHSCVRSWWRAVHRTSAPPAWDAYSRRVAEALRAAGLVVAPTAAMLGALECEYGDLAAGIVIPNGRDCVDRIPALGDKSAVIFSAGRIWDQAKNIEAVCEVAPSLDWPVCVAGGTTSPDGDVRRPPNVELLGRLAHEDMDEWYSRAAIYALPARYEPFGLSVLEAAAAGCALVLGDIPSLRENWDGAAMFVAPEDRVQLADALACLIADPAVRGDLGRRAQDRARGFTLARMADGYLGAYDLLRQHSAAGSLLHAS